MSKIPLSELDSELTCFMLNLIPPLPTLTPSVHISNIQSHESLQTDA